MGDKSFLSMTDEDFLRDSPLPPEAYSEEGSEEPTEVVEDSGSEVINDDSTAFENGSDMVDDDDDDLDLEPHEVEDEDLDSTDEETTDEVTDDEEESEEDSTEESEKTETDSELNRILEPFKANGTELQVKNVDEAITLMQMGANFTKKMQSLQPNLKLVKTLEKNELLDEGKLNYLIDLHNKDPKAIAQLVKESGINPMDLDSDGENTVDYTPNNHQVSEQTMQLDTVLDDVESTPTGARCLDIVGNQWDKASQTALSSEPKLIADLNKQMSDGTFDKINAEVERVRVFGGLTGMSNFDAYKAVGREMLQKGLLGQKPEPVAKTTIKKSDPVRSQKRKAATIPKATRKTPKQEINVLAMSDEEFIKMNDLNI